MTRVQVSNTAQAKAELEAVSDELALGVLERTLGYQLAQANVSMKRVFQRHVGEPFQLRAVEFSVLALLATNRQVSPKHLGAVLGMPAPNLKVILDRLIDRGLLLRTRSTQDKRAQVVTLTRDGQVLAKRSLAIAEHMEDAALAHLSAAERAILLELLGRVIRAARAS
jgi:DNA-binding MarR family transcriptional regulator